MKRSKFASRSKLWTRSVCSSSSLLSSSQTSPFSLFSRAATRSQELTTPKLSFARWISSLPFSTHKSHSLSLRPSQAGRGFNFSRKFCTDVLPTDSVNWLQKLLLIAVPTTVLAVGGRSFYEWWNVNQEKMDIITNRVDMPLILQELFEITAPRILDHPMVLQVMGPTGVDAPKVRTGWHSDKEAWVTYPIRGNRGVATVMIELLPVHVPGHDDEEKKIPNLIWHVVSIEVDLQNGTKLELDPSFLRPINLQQRHDKLVATVLQRQKEMQTRQQQQQKQRAQQ